MTSSHSSRFLNAAPAAPEVACVEWAAVHRRGIASTEPTRAAHGATARGSGPTSRPMPGTLPVETASAGARPASLRHEALPFRHEALPFRREAVSIIREATPEAGEAFPSFSEGISPRRETASTASEGFSAAREGVPGASEEPSFVSKPLSMRDLAKVGAF